MVVDLGAEGPAGEAKGGGGGATEGGGGFLVLSPARRGRGEGPPDKRIFPG